MLQPVPQLFERAPPRIGLEIRMLVRLVVQVLAADRAEARTVGAAEDLLRQRERDRIPRPRPDLELLVDDVLRAEALVRVPGGIVELADGDGNFQLRMTEAAHAGTGHANVEPKAEDRRPRGLGDLELRRHRVGARLVALPAEAKRLELDVDPLPAELPGTNAQPAEIDRRRHGLSVAPSLDLVALSHKPPLRMSLDNFALEFDLIMEPDRWLGLDLRHLVALKTIADQGSFGRAAERLGYTQSAVSQQIATLERIVGLRLIERPGGPRPISLTEAGLILLRHAEAIDARLLAAKADMKALEDGDAGRLRVGTFQSVGTRVLPTLLRRFSEAHPKVEIVLRESMDEAELLGMVERGELDLTFWTLPVAPGPYEAVELLRDPYVLVVPAGSPLAALRRPPSLKEIALQPLIGFNPCSAMDQIESHLASTGRAPNVVFRSDNNGTVQGLVGAGVGVSVAPLLTVDEDDESVAVIDLQERIPPRIIGLVWHRDRHRTPAAEAFAKAAIAVCRELASEPAAA